MQHAGFQFPEQGLNPCPLNFSSFKMSSYSLKPLAVCPHLPAPSVPTHNVFKLLKSMGYISYFLVVPIH